MTRPILESPAASDASGLVVQNLGLQLERSPRLLLQDLNFVLQPGEVAALLGGRGSGKTLLLQLLNGLRTASHGNILWRGHDIATFTPVELRRQIVWVPQQPRLLGMTVGEAIAYPLRLQGLNSSEIQQRMDVWLGILGLPLEWLELPSGPLSHAAAQGIALARALVMEPHLLLLDNPWPQSLTIPVEAGTRAVRESPLAGGEASRLPLWNQPQDSIEQALVKLTQRGGTVFWAGAAKIKIAQRLLVLGQGRLQSDAPASSVAWEQATAELKATEATKLLDSTEEEDWD